MLGGSETFIQHQTAERFTVYEWQTTLADTDSSIYCKAFYPFVGVGRTLSVCACVSVYWTYCECDCTASID